MKMRRIRASLASLLLAVLILSSCNDRSRELEEEANRLAAERARLEQIQAIQRAAEQARQEQLAALQREAEKARLQQEAIERRVSNVRNYSRAAATQLMNAIGGGQDLIVQQGQWYYDTTTDELEIPMAVSFNGLVFRSNNYQLNGVLTVKEDGSNPRFARRQANENYQNAESTITALVVTAAGIVILSDMSQESNP
jgi:glycogen debranching enzyme